MVADDTNAHFVPLRALEAATRTRALALFEAEVHQLADDKFQQVFNLEAVRKLRLPGPEFDLVRQEYEDRAMKVEGPSRYSDDLDCVAFQKLVVQLPKPGTLFVTLGRVIPDFRAELEALAMLLPPRITVKWESAGSLRYKIQVGSWFNNPAVASAERFIQLSLREQERGQDHGWAINSYDWHEADARRFVDQFEDDDEMGFRLAKVRDRGAFDTQKANKIWKRFRDAGRLPVPGNSVMEFLIALQKACKSQMPPHRNLYEESESDFDDEDGQPDPRDGRLSADFTPPKYWGEQRFVAQARHRARSCG